jgi:hypothetical protein
VSRIFIIIIYKEGLCSSSGDIIKLMMMIMVEDEQEKFESFVQPDMLLIVRWFTRGVDPLSYAVV